MPKKQKSGFFKNVNKFFQRVQNQDLVKIGDGQITTFNAPADKEEMTRKAEFSVFRQYLQQKNWSTRHQELFGEYRKMDESYPIISAALRLYSQEVCLGGDTVLRTPAGDMSIKELYFNRGKNKDFFMVQSYNKDHRRVEWNLCSYIKSNGIKKVYEVEVERNLDPTTAAKDTILKASFKCTSNHKIMINASGEFKEVGQLKPGDAIFGLYKWIDPKCKCKKDNFVTTKILSIKEAGEEEVFDLVNVATNNHFSIKLTDSFYVEVHNCTKDTEGNVIKIITSNTEIKEALQECFFDNLKMNTQAYLLAKEMMKFGNLYCFLNTRRGVGVTDLVLLPPEAIRIQLLPDAETLDAFRYDWMGMGGSTHFEPWELVHWRNIEDIELQPYGTSILRSIVDTWRRIILMREALIIYRITRAPQRYLFKIDTSGMDADAALKYADEMKKSLFKKTMVNPATGEIDFKYNPMSIEENYYMPTFQDDVGGISVLEGASNMSDIEDFKIIKDDLFAGLLIPKSYLCLHPDTKIKCLDGKHYNILQLEEKYKKGEKVWVYSAKPTGEIIPGEVEWAGPTKKFKTTYLIELDNGEKIEASGSHPFMLRNGEYKNAENLSEGESLMPLYTRLDERGYESVCHNKKMKNGRWKWQQTHQMVVLSKDKNFYHQNNEGKIVCHHKDMDKLNNHPDNLERTSQKAHIKLHEDIARKNFCSSESREKNKISHQTAEYREKISSLRKKYFEVEGNSKSISEANIKYKKTQKMLEVYEEKISNKELSQFGENNGNYKGLISKEELLLLLEVYSFKSLVELRNRINLDFPKVRKHFYLYDIAKILNLPSDEFSKKYFGKKSKKNTKSRFIINEEKIKELIEQGLTASKIGNILGCGCNTLNTYLKKYGQTFFEYAKESTLYFNHKIKSITVKEYEEEQQFYCLSVKEYHNFALAAGVIVSNSFEEDLSNKAALCLRADTKLLTNEGVKEISFLAEEFSKDSEKKIFALSCNKYGIVSSGKIMWCKPTKKVTELYKIHINDVTYVECTNNHPFLMDDLSYIKAEDLQVGLCLKGIYEGQDFIVSNIEIIKLDAEEFVYDLEVEEYHNFALDAGVFVHNSQEDLRFSGAIKQYQSYFIEGLLHIALVHLHINGFSEEDLSSFEIEMNTNSTLAEKTRNELLQQRIDLAKSALDDSNGMAIMSYTQVLKDILKFTDDEISRTFKDQLIEKKIIWRLNQLKENGFYDEPEQEKKRAIMKGLNADQDVFSNIHFEAKIPEIKSILTEKLDKELAHLIRPTKIKATKKMVENIISNNEYEKNRNEFLERKIKQKINYDRRI